MSEKKEQPQIEKTETRSYKYLNDESNVAFEFEIDVSKPEIALAEIADFKELMSKAIKDLTILSKEVAKDIEPPKKKGEEQQELESEPIITASK